MSPFRGKGRFSQSKPLRYFAYEHGQGLVEFALVFLVFYLLLAGTVELGRLFFVSQLLQEVARVGARELALTPLGATATFEEGIEQTADRIFDPERLVVNLDNYPNPGDLDAYFAGLPAVNRLLRPAMIFESITVGGTTCRLLRYPGALLVPPEASGPCDFVVAIPRVVARGAGGVETVEWIPVVEEVRPDRADPETGPFSIASTGPERALVALRINYPYQAAMLSGFQSNPADPTGPNLDFRITPDDAGVSAPEPPGGALLPDDGRAVPYAGPFGLGRQLAFAQELRPFRKLISGQAMFRREVLLP